MQTRSTYRLPCVGEIVESGRGRLGWNDGRKDGYDGYESKRCLCNPIFRPIGAGWPIFLFPALLRYASFISLYKSSIARFAGTTHEVPFISRPQSRFRPCLKNRFSILSSRADIELLVADPFLYENVNRVEKKNL